ncbi:MAG: hypothetical protein AB7F88_10475 [Pyrinomonadaceae bacterium]
MLDTAVANTGVGFRSTHQYDYQDTIITAQKINWRIEDIIGGDKKLDSSKPFMPESLARVEELSFLNDDEKRTLNHIRANAYLSIFGVVEEFILPFVLDHVRPSLDKDDYRVRALLQFAGEEAKHIQLFKMFREEFNDGFGSECEVIGPGPAVAKEILAHDPLSVALVILHIEWMTQGHYIGSIKDDNDLDPQFKSLLKNHWLEEAQHAKLDTNMVAWLAEGRSREEIEKAVDGYLAIGAFLDGANEQQTKFDLDSFERATGRVLTEDERFEFFKVQLQANRWTYLGSGMTHPKFLDTLEELGPEHRARIEEVAPMFS